MMNDHHAAHSATLLSRFPERVEYHVSASVAPSEQFSPLWKNWIGNLKYSPNQHDGKYYYVPKNFSELQLIIKKARIVNQGVEPSNKINVRVSGQRHASAPLIVNDIGPPKINTKHGKTWVVNLSCYCDLGEHQRHNVVLDTKNLTVTVNTGVTELALQKFLAAHGYTLKVFTAGGFFSIGGITAVDVHGGVNGQSIFASNVTAFTVLEADSKQRTYDTKSANFYGYHPLQFYRASLGTLGIVTSVTIKITALSYSNAIKPAYAYYTTFNKHAFIHLYKSLLFSGADDNVETFYNPYAKKSNLLTLTWRINGSDARRTAKRNLISATLSSTCEHAVEKRWGGGYLHPSFAGKSVKKINQWTQKSHVKAFGHQIISSNMQAITYLMKEAITNQNVHWLPYALATRCAFMSYFIPLPNDDGHGLETAWNALQVITALLKKSRHFISAAPVEFRFVRSSDAVLSGTYARKGKEQLFISIDVIVYVNKGSSKKYPNNVLNYLAFVEKQWVKMGGFPHHGKMYGFYAPFANNQNGSRVRGKAAYNAQYIYMWQQRKNKLLDVFRAYQSAVDPNGLFCNHYTRYLGICK